MKLKDYSIGNIIVFITRIAMIMGLAFNIRPLTIIPAALLGVVAGIGVAGGEEIFGLSRRSYAASLTIFAVIICVAISGNVKGRAIMALFPLLDVVTIMYSQWKGIYVGKTLEDLDRGNF